jgi:hypothetical protein
LTVGGDNGISLKILALQLLEEARELEGLDPGEFSDAEPLRLFLHNVSLCDQQLLVFVENGIQPVCF